MFMQGYFHNGLAPKRPPSLEKLKQLYKTTIFANTSRSSTIVRLQASWKDDLSETERLGLTTNVLTRIRICSPSGTPDFSFKGAPDQIPQGYTPWFQVPNRASHTDTILFGHWSALGVVVQDNLIGLDGGCVWGRELVAIRLEDRELFRVACGEK